MMPQVADDARDYPTGLCLCLTDRELEKLDLDDEGVEQGDYLHLFIMAKVRGYNKSERGTRIDLQVVAMSIEDESTEAAPDDEDDE
jgi:hypothetical protein